jgi:hypothetical protein
VFRPLRGSTQSPIVKAFPAMNVPISGASANLSLQLIGGKAIEQPVSSAAAQIGLAAKVLSRLKSGSMLLAVGE